MRMTHHSNTLHGLGTGALLTQVEPVAIHPQPGGDWQATVKAGAENFMTPLKALTVQDTPDRPDRLARLEDFPKVIVAP